MKREVFIKAYKSIRKDPVKPGKIIKSKKTYNRKKVRQNESTG